MTTVTEKPPATYAEQMAWQAAQFAEMADAAASGGSELRKLGEAHAGLRKNASLAAAVASLAELEVRLRRLATSPPPLPLRRMAPAGTA